MSESRPGQSSTRSCESKSCSALATWVVSATWSPRSSFDFYLCRDHALDALCRFDRMQLGGQLVVVLQASKLSSPLPALA